MKLLKHQLRSKFKPCMAALMAFMMVFGIMPLNVLASTGILNEPEPIIEAEPFMARVDGEEVLVSAEGIAYVQAEGFDEPIAMEIPRYIYLDGKQIPIDDDSIENIAPVVEHIMPLRASLRMAAEPTPSIGFIVSISGALPNNPTVGQIGPEFTHPAYVTMNGRIVSSRRYIVIINGVHYEAFCADPNLPGPETNASVYELTGADGLMFRTVLRYGFPINPSLTSGDDDDRAWHVYITRVAIAYVSRPNATWGNLTGGTRSAVDNRLNGTGGAAAKANSPAITVNGMIDREEDGDIPLSPPFVLGHSRRTNCQRNPFRFEWDQITPAGTRLYVDGSYVATAPTNPTDIFTVNRPSSQFRAAVEFHFVMPQGSEGQTARVSLVGINNQYSGRVFVMQNPNDTDNWQDIVFYVPEVLAHAAYTWDTDPHEDFGRLRIIKTDIQGNNLAGAVFNIDGPDPSMPLTGVIVPASGWTSGPLELGSYTITEVTPPSGFTLASNPTQTVNVTADHSTQAPAIATFTKNNDVRGCFTMSCEPKDKGLAAKIGGKQTIGLAAAIIALLIIAVILIASFFSKDSALPEIRYIFALDYAYNMTVVVTFDEEPPVVQFIAPDRSLVDMDNIRYRPGYNFIQYFLPNAMPGIWRMAYDPLTNTEINTPYSVYMEHIFIRSFDVDASEITDESIRIAFEVSADNIGEFNYELHAVFTAPDNSIANEILLVKGYGMLNEPLLLDVDIGATQDMGGLMLRLMAYVQHGQASIMDTAWVDLRVHHANFTD